MNTTPSPSLEPLLDYVIDAVEGNHLPLPQALVRMLPHAEAAQLAMRILTQADIIEVALAHYAESLGHGSPERDEASNAACTMQQFRHVLTKETSRLKESPAAAPLTGTSARSLVHVLADAISTMPEPTDADGGWRHAARKQIETVGSHYAQTWPDATYWRYIREQDETKDNAS